VIHNDNEEAARLVARQLNTERLVPSRGMYSFDTDILVVVGADWASLVESDEGRLESLVRTRLQDLHELRSEVVPAELLLKPAAVPSRPFPERDRDCLRGARSYPPGLLRRLRYVHAGTVLLDQTRGSSPQSSLSSVVRLRGRRRTCWASSCSRIGTSAKRVMSASAVRVTRGTSRLGIEPAKMRLSSPRVP
jgi:hypothetical protein